MRQFLPFFVVFAAVWALQLYATAKQGQHFMREVGRLRPAGETAIGASSHSRLRRRTYVAIAADETDLVTAAVELDGVTVFARARPVPDLIGTPLRELADAPDGERRSDAARMAARALLGEELEPSPARVRSARGVAAPTASRTTGSARTGHLPGARPRSEEPEGEATT